VFDIAFSELVVIAVVALVVIGPEKLPKVARTVGLLVGRLQRYVSTVKADIDRELRVAELNQLRQDIKENAQAIHSGISKSTSAVIGEVKEIEQTISSPAPAKATNEKVTSSEPNGDSSPK